MKDVAMEETATESHVDVQPLPMTNATEEKPTDSGTATAGEASLSRRERKAAKKARKEEKWERKRNKKLVKRLPLAVSSVRLPPAEEPKTTEKTERAKRGREAGEKKAKRAACTRSKPEAKRDFPRQMTDLRRHLNQRKEDLPALRAAALDLPVPPRTAQPRPATTSGPSFQHFPVLPRQPGAVIETPVAVAAVAGQAPAASTQQAAYVPRVADQTYIAQILDVEAES